eukprot:1149268-Prorocentrum_minimum.AAC.1
MCVWRCWCCPHLRLHGDGGVAGAGELPEVFELHSVQLHLHVVQPPRVRLVQTELTVPRHDQALVQRPLQP